MNKEVTVHIEGTDGTVEGFVFVSDDYSGPEVTVRWDAERKQAPVPKDERTPEHVVIHIGGRAMDWWSSDKESVVIHNCGGSGP